MVVHIDLNHQVRKLPCSISVLFAISNFGVIAHSLNVFYSCERLIDYDSPCSEIWKQVLKRKHALDIGNAIMPVHGSQLKMTTLPSDVN